MRYNKPESADRITINKQNLVSPSNPFVSDSSKDAMKENFQKEKEKSESSKPTNEILEEEISSTFEEDTNHTEYVSNIEETENTDENVDEGNFQTFDDVDQIYDNTNEEEFVIEEFGTSDRYGEYAVISDSEQSVNVNNKGNNNVIFEESKFEIPKNFKSNIIVYPYNFYKNEKTQKTQIILHHTVSSPNAGKGVIDDWNKRANGIATHYVMDGKGTIFQAFDTDYWAHHIGTKDKRNKSLNKKSISIEISNWGGLTKKGDKYYNAYNGVIKNENIIEFKDGYHSFYHFQKYTKDQLNALRTLLVDLCNKYNISKSYNSDMWDYSESAMNGENGIWTHVSYRPDKSDCFPQPDLIGMLKSL